MIVNGRGHSVAITGKLTYEMAVELAGLPPREDYTVTYRVRGGPSGSLSPRAWVPLGPGMVVDVAHTGNA